MIDLQPLRVKQEPRGRRGGRAIARVTDYRRARRGQVNADLVPPSGHRFGLDQDAVSTAIENANMGEGRNA